VEFVLTTDVEQFAARADGFLAERVERNVLATVLLEARRQRSGGGRQVFAYGIDNGARVVAAALRTPPWPLLVSELDEASADALMDAWLTVDPSVPGVNAAAASARANAAAWTRRTGGSTRCRMHEAMHVLTEVHDPPRPAPGRLRIATDRERELLIAWERAFAGEAAIGPGERAQQVVEARWRAAASSCGTTLAPSRFLALSPAIAGTVRIGPVYTPPEYRRRGYASTAVATAARRALAGGARQCMLFTDLANPTSNKPTGNGIQHRERRLAPAAASSAGGGI
jgi:predicted GNAT family acetyltransferase